MRLALYYFLVGWLDWWREQRQVPVRTLLPAHGNSRHWRRFVFSGILVLAIVMLAGVPLGELVKTLPVDMLEQPNVMPLLATSSALSLVLVSALGLSWLYRRGRHLARFCHQMHDRGRALVLAQARLAS